ncbi:HNH endonuclease [Chitinophaga sp. CB10]|uniref:HNH endonuclease n=1 Tax=Chitinophaga sp. CB10 TaxID=1891659 RepID=UPI00345C2431
MHKAYERDKKIVEAKKKEVLKKLGTLTCEVCDFNFKNTYGDWGDGYIECHHKLPLGKLKVRTLTKLNDLALVCANCHRMLHRRIDALTVEGLKMLLISNKNKG